MFQICGSKPCLENVETLFHIIFLFFVVTAAFNLPESTATDIDVNVDNILTNLFANNSCQIHIISQNVRLYFQVPQNASSSFSIRQFRPIESVRNSSMDAWDNDLVPPKIIQRDNEDPPVPFNPSNMKRATTCVYAILLFAFNEINIPMEGRLVKSRTYAPYLLALKELQRFYGFSSKEQGNQEDVMGEPINLFTLHVSLGLQPLNDDTRIEIHQNIHYLNIHTGILDCPDINITSTIEPSTCQSMYLCINCITPWQYISVNYTTLLNITAFESFSELIGTPKAWTVMKTREMNTTDLETSNRNKNPFILSSKVDSAPFQFAILRILSSESNSSIRVIRLSDTEDRLNEIFPEKRMSIDYKFEATSLFGFGFKRTQVWKTFVVSSEGYNFITCYSNDYLSISYYFQPFQVELWIALLVYLPILSVLTHFLLVIKKCNKSDFNSYFFAYSSMLEHCYYVPDYLFEMEWVRIVLGLWLLISCIFTNAYKGIAITGVTAPAEKASVKTFTELVDDNITTESEIDMNSDDPYKPLRFRILTPFTVENLESWKRGEWDLSLKDTFSYVENATYLNYDEPIRRRLETADYLTFLIDTANEYWKLVTKMSSCFGMLDNNLYPLEGFSKEELPVIKACRLVYKLSNPKRYIVPERELDIPQYSKSYDTAIERELVDCDKRVVYVDYEEKISREETYLSGHYHSKTFFKGNQSFLVDWTVWQFDNGRGSRVPLIFQLLIENGIYKKLESFYKNRVYFGLRQEYTRMHAYKELSFYFFLGIFADDATRHFKRLSSKLPRSLGVNFGFEYEKKSNHSLYTTSKHRIKDHAFIPRHYDIELGLGFVDIPPKTKCNSISVSFPGKVKIFGVSQTDLNHLQVKTELDLFTRLGVNTSSIQITTQGNLIPITSFDYDTSTNLLNIQLSRTIEGGKEIEIYMEYRALLQDSHPFGLLHVLGSYGIVPCRTSPHLDKYPLMVTNFNKDDITRSSECSKLFPCIDDHVLRSTFNLTLIRESDYKTVANGELVGSFPTSENDRYVVDKYRWTTRIRPSLLAFAVFKNYSYVERTFGKEKKPMRIYFPNEYNDKNHFGGVANASANMLTYYYEDYFGTSSHLKGVDIFIIQSYFKYTIENLELNVYVNLFDEIYLSPDWKTESTKSIQMIQHIASGLALQWVGPWWDPERSFKLTNSFPRYMEYLGLEAANVAEEGERKAIADFAVVSDLRKLQKQIGFPAQIQIQEWNKGAVLLRMMEGILSRNILREIHQPYFKYLRRENETMSIEEFYPETESIFEEFAKFAMSKILTSFIENGGIPLARIAVKNETHFSITQEPFGVESLETWALPVTTSTSKILDSETDQELHVHVLLPSDKMILIEGNTSEIILFNYDGKGYHRTLYENATLLANIQSQLELYHEGIPPVGRAKLIDDYFRFAENGYCSYGAIFNLTSYMNKNAETSLAVWTTFLDQISTVYLKFISHPQYPKLARFLLPKIDNALESLVPPYSLTESKLRDTLLYFSCQLQSPYCIAKAQTLFAEWHANDYNDTNPLDSIKPYELREILECAIVASGGQKAVDFMFAKYKNDFEPRFVRSLACATDESILKELLQKTLQDPALGGFDHSDADQFIEHLLRVPIGKGRASIIPFIASNFEKVVEKMGHGETEFVVHIISTLSRQYFSTKEQLDEVTELIRQHKDEILSDHNNQRELDEAYEVFEDNIKWMNSYGKDILSSL
ncbi:unnamed protein product [Orchesella dallaii]|uniref:ERAP1-like C-terminal domain-containing protein n=1 Tax=Orchesella dallaii TaxID=48710 RepID=A0ABP1S8E5_9HEXA